MQVAERIDKEMITRIEDRTTTPVSGYKAVSRCDGVQVAAATEMPDLYNACSQCSVCIRVTSAYLVEAVYRVGLREGGEPLNMSERSWRNDSDIGHDLLED